jgi:RNA polymerase sigma factor (sigma-70 family)
MGFKIYRAKDQEWIEGCKKGDSTVQRQVFDHYSGKMYSVCCRYVKDKMEAEDVLVTAFTKVFERIHQFKSEGSFEGWIRRIMVNESLTWLRQHKFMQVETDIEAADFEPDYQMMENHLHAEDLLKLIDELPAGYKVVFNLYAIEGYSHKEISEQLGINENTSKSQLSRARVYLQKQLAMLQDELIKNDDHGKQIRQTVQG